MDLGVSNREIIILATCEKKEEEEIITLFNGTFNSTQVLHKAGGIGLENRKQS